MVELKSVGEIAAMREAGRVVAEILTVVQANAAAGVTLRSLDALARSVLAERGATSTFLGYQPGFAPTAFPAVICASVNDVALHGIPDDYHLRSGDLLSIDCGADIGAPSRSPSARRALPMPGWPRRPAGPCRPASGRRCQARGSAIFHMRSARSAGTAATGSTPTSAGTGSDGTCTRTRRCRTRDGQSGA